MGASFVNMVTSVIGVCGIRIVWILTVFSMFGSFESLFVCYPLSWFGTGCMHFLMFVILFKKDSVKIDQDILENSEKGIETKVLIGERIGEKNA